MRLADLQTDPAPRVRQDPCLYDVSQIPAMEELCCMASTILHELVELYGGDWSMTRCNRIAWLLAQKGRRKDSAYIKKLVVLTTRTAHWFRERGFVAGDKSDLPSRKKSLYNHQRNSRVYYKQLSR